MTYDPKAKNKRAPLGAWPKYMGKSRLLLKEKIKKYPASLKKKWSGVG
ncbi:hypothetical protein [Paenibacillus sp. Y412MC10]|nr:hypothetical protein [Paenibacillus sp. Y412MC10]